MVSTGSTWCKGRSGEVVIPVVALLHDAGVNAIHALPHAAVAVIVVIVVAVVAVVRGAVESCSPGIVLPACPDFVYFPSEWSQIEEDPAIGISLYQCDQLIDAIHSQINASIDRLIQLNSLRPSTNRLTQSISGLMPLINRSMH